MVGPRGSRFAALEQSRGRFTNIGGLWLILLWFVSSAFAGGVVTNCIDSLLRAAIAGGGTVTFACDGTVTLTNTISIGADTILDGTGHQVTVNGSNTVRLFYINTNVSFSVRNVVLANGLSSAGSAILNDGGRLNLAGVVLRTNVASLSVYDGFTPRGWGGAIFNRAGVVGVTNCSFTGNTASNPATDDRNMQAGGGAVRNESGQLTLDTCFFAANRATGASAPFPQFAGASGLGGAIHNAGALVITRCTFTDNSASGGNGYNSQGTAGGVASGGAVFSAGTFTADQSSFFRNSAVAGAGGQGVYGGGGGGPGGLGGTGGVALGGAVCNSGTLTISRSTFASNGATGGNGGAGGNGGVFMDVGGSGGMGGLGGSGDAGALFNNGTASLVNCTVAANKGNGGGGGPGGHGGDYVRWGGNGGNGGTGGNGLGGIDGTCNVTNCTLAWNVGTGGSGGPGGAASIAQHPGSPGTAGSSGSAYGATPCASLVNTLIASNAPPGNDSFADPKLGPLANNGGVTFTIALLAGSPAINAADPAAAPATDQRGIVRPVGPAPDIGAFEYGLPPALSIGPFGANGMEMVASAYPGLTCLLLSSSNLLNWIPIDTNQIGLDGTAMFHGGSASGIPSRFYRLVIP